MPLELKTAQLFFRKKREKEKRVFLKPETANNRECWPELPTKEAFARIEALRKYVSKFPPVSVSSGKIVSPGVVLGKLEGIEGDVTKLEAFMLFDSKFNIPNNYHLKLMIMWTYYRMITKEGDATGHFPHFQNLVKFGQTVALIFYDGDGVSGWNNNYNHVLGDYFLEALVNKLNPATNHEVLNLIKRFKAKWFFARFAGDEYVLVVETPGQEVTCCSDSDGNLANLVEQIIQVTQKSCEAVDLFQLLAVDKQELARKIRFPKKIEINFSMPITVSAGWCTFSPLFLGLTEEKVRAVLKSNDRTQILYKLLDWTLSQGSGNMEKQKLLFKKVLEGAQDPQGSFLHYFYSRTDFAQRQLQENQYLQKKNRWLVGVLIGLFSVLSTVIAAIIWQKI